MRDMTFGGYYGTNSVVHRLDPRTKILLVIAFIVMVFFVNTFFMFGVLAAFLLFVILIAKLHLLKILRAIRGIIILVLISSIIITLASAGVSYPYPEVALGNWWIFTIYQSALINSGIMAIRLLLLMLVPTIMTLTTTPMEITDALDSFLKPLALIKLPVYAITLIMSIGLRFVPVLFEETDRIARAQKARGADFESRNIFRRAKSMVSILIPLFISALRSAGDLADAMDSRCFRGGKRTKLKKLRFGFKDLFAVLIIASLFFAVLLFLHNWWSCGWLTSFRGMVS